MRDKPTYIVLPNPVVGNTTLNLGNELIGVIQSRAPQASKDTVIGALLGTAYGLYLGESKELDSKSNRIRFIAYLDKLLGVVT